MVNEDAHPTGENAYHIHPRFNIYMFFRTFLPLLSSLLVLVNRVIHYCKQGVLFHSSVHWEGSYVINRLASVHVSVLNIYRTFQNYSCRFSFCTQ